MRIFTLTLVKLLTVLVAFMGVYADASTESTAYQEINFINPDTNEPLLLSVWYPAGAHCEQAAICLKYDVKSGHTALISHGAMGSAREFDWLGKFLASDGYIVVGINHYGESWVYGRENIDTKRIGKPWLRPKEVSAALDILQKNKTQDNKVLFSHPVSWDKVTAIGFSSGGSTVTSLVGAMFDFESAYAYCLSEKSQGDLSCHYFPRNKKKGELISVSNLPKVTKSLIDQRVEKVITLDPAPGQLISKESLEKINKPVLVIGSEKNDFLRYESHALYFAQNIPNAEHVKLSSGEGHFVYLDRCNLDIRVFGVPLCQDKEGIDRDTVHNKLMKDINNFLLQ